MLRWRACRYLSLLALLTTCSGTGGFDFEEAVEAAPDFGQVVILTGCERHESR